MSFSYSQVTTGALVMLHNGKVVEVTDAASQDLGDYYNESGSLPRETIFIGTTSAGKTIVSDMSEIVSIIA